MRVAGLATVFAAGLVTGMIFRPSTVVQAQGARVFELRTYTSPDGKLDALQKRFRDHTRRIFDKHGMTSIGYWVPQDEPLKSNTLIYILAHPSREAAKKNWAEFGADPEWKQVSAESQKDGPIVSKVVSVFMDAADYSAIK
jgi:hypothetical protein